jgi:hypothetical protein
VARINKIGNVLRKPKIETRYPYWGKKGILPITEFPTPNFAQIKGSSKAINPVALEVPRLQFFNSY